MTKTSTRLMALTSSIALAAGLAACAPYDPYGPNNYPGQTPAATYPGAYPAQQVGVEYGRVTSVSLIRPATGAAPVSPAGTVIGAVVGGALGNQVGSGGGRAAATILGAVGGAYAGNRIAGGGKLADFGAQVRHEPLRSRAYFRIGKIQFRLLERRICAA